MGAGLGRAYAMASSPSKVSAKRFHLGHQARSSFRWSLRG